MNKKPATSIMFFNMGQTRPLLCLFSFLSHQHHVYLGFKQTFWLSPNTKHMGNGWLAKTFQNRDNSHDVEMPMTKYF